MKPLGAVPSRSGRRGGGGPRLPAGNSWHGRYRRLLGVAVLGPLLLSSGVGAESPSAQRGKLIFHSGTTPEGGEILAAMGPEGIEVPASILPCSSCHGFDGKGRSEGGITPSDLTWTALTKPYGLAREDGRRLPPYDEASLRRAVTMGIDSAGAALDTAMPRYRLMRTDADDLVAYIRTLGTELEAGVTERTIRIATLLPKTGEVGAVLGPLLAAYFQDLNERGGVYGRQVELVRIDAPEHGGEIPPDQLRRWLREAEALALVAPAVPITEPDQLTLFEELGLPVVGPLVGEPWIELPPNRYVFYLHGGLDEQVRALLQFASERLAAEGSEGAGRRLLVVRPSEAGGEEALATATEQAGNLDWESRVEWLGKEGSVLAGGPTTSVYRPDAVLLLEAALPGRLLAEVLRLAEGRPVLLPASEIGSWQARDAGGFTGQVLSALPFLPSDTSPAGYRVFEDLLNRHGLSPTFPQLQLEALSAVTLLVEGLKRVGRQLRREALVQELEGLYQFETGFAPTVSFGPNRRIGSQGAHLIEITTDGEWVPLARRLDP